MFRKFFDPAATEPKFQLGEEISLNDVFESMRAVEPEPVADPVVTEPAKADEPTPEPTVAIVEPEPTPTPAAVIPEPDWRELVKKQNPKDVFSLLEIDEDALKLSKELKEDEFIKKLVTYRKEHGNVTPFIEAATKDYDKLSHLDLLRDDLKKQYPTLSKEKFEVLAKNRIDKRFILGEDADPEEVELASVDLEVEGERIRQLRKTEQQSFLDSVKPVDRTAEVSQAQKEKMDADLKEFEEFRQSIEASPITSKLFAEKKIVFGEKEKSFNYTVDPATIKDMTLDTTKFYGLFWEDGKFNQQKWNKVAAYAQNMAAIEESFVNHGMSMGTKVIMEDELEDAKPKTDQSAKTQTKKSLAKTFADEGQAITLQELFGG